jgi:hypothetical protein
MPGRQTRRVYIAPFQQAWSDIVNDGNEIDVRNTLMQLRLSLEAAVDNKDSAVLEETICQDLVRRYNKLANYFEEYKMAITKTGRCFRATTELETKYLFCV